MLFAPHQGTFLYFLPGKYPTLRPFPMVRNLHGSKFFLKLSAGRIQYQCGGVCRLISIRCSSLSKS